MPNLETLDCSHNLIRKANFSKLSKLKSLKISRNTDLTSLTLPSNSPIVFDIIDVSETKLSRYTLVNNLIGRCKKFIANGVESLDGTLSVRNYYPLTHVEVQHTNIETVDLYCPTLESFIGTYNPNLKTVLVENGAEKFTAACGGVNADVEVRLYNSALVKKWFQYSANNPLNDHASPSFRVNTKDDKQVWVPITSADGVTNLNNFCKQNAYGSWIHVNGRDLKITMLSAGLNSWFANSYYVGNEHVKPNLAFFVKGSTKYCVVNSVEEGKSISEMAQTLTDASQLTISNDKITLICYTPEQMKKWFETCDQYFGERSDVQLRLTFKDRKTTTVPVTKEKVEGRSNMLNFCKEINYNQYGLSYGYIYLYLKDDEKEKWYGRAPSRDSNNQLVYIKYSTGNNDVRIAGYAYRPNK
jgi:hypothetical protein